MINNALSMLYRVIAMVLSVFLIISCRSEESYGYLIFDNLELSVDNEVFPITRSVDSRFRVQLINGNNVSYEFAPNDNLSERKQIATGTYMLKVFTDNKDIMPNNGELGQPIYEAIKQITIRPNELNRVSLRVPQTNVSVSFSLSNQVQSDFMNIMVEVFSQSGRRYTYTDVSDLSNLCYFSLSNGEVLSYTISAINSDNERVSYTKAIPVTEKKKYLIAISL